jgi:pimeloyl-ACP methyl ester carboxylesterase
MPLYRTCDGVEIFYERVGSGPEVIVLIPGTGVDHVYWHLQVEPLLRSGRFTLIMANMRGAGRSTVLKDMDRYSSSIMASDVVGILNQEAVASAHMIGHSLGSCVAQQLGLIYPDRVLTLQMHATWGRADEWMKRAWIGTAEYPLLRGDAHQTFRTISMWAFSPEYLETRKPDYVADQIRRTMIDNPHLQANEGMLGHLHADKTHDTIDQLSHIRAPTLVTAGEFDYLIPQRYSQIVADRIPSSKFHLFKGPRSSHSYNFELLQEFNTVMMRALTG